jgi:NAD(P)-dependent dehydrogenase (short-subunit alcohol dehydrogenase family)
MAKKTKEFPDQHQKEKPGKQSKMKPLPTEGGEYQGANKLLNKVAIITGGDSGIGRSIAILYAREGADCVVVYFNEHEDAKRTQDLVEKEGRECLLISGNLEEEEFSKEIVKKTIKKFGKIDIVVNNAADQTPRDDISEISSEQLIKTFKTNIFSQFYLVKAALKHMKENSCIINTTSVTAYRGSAHLLDYSSTKGAIVSFTRSLALSLAEKNIRVNGVAPGPVWTPLIPATFKGEKIEKFGHKVALKRAGQPDEIAPCYVFLASNDSSYMTGQVLHPNGGEIINT